MFTTLLTLINGFVQWFTTTIPTGRLAGDSNPTRIWYTKALGYKLGFDQSSLQTVTDRTALNAEIIARNAIQDVNKKQGIQALKTEIDNMYSFQKCFVARHRTRLQYYRDDLSQKGYRNMYAVNLSADNLQLLQTLLDSQSS